MPAQPAAGHGRLVAAVLVFLLGFGAVVSTVVALGRRRSRDERERSARAGADRTRRDRRARRRRDEAKQTRNAAARQAAGLLLDRGIEDARGGEPARALHLFVQALRALPADDPQAAPLERVIRANLSAWAETVPALEHIWPGGPRFDRRRLYSRRRSDRHGRREGRDPVLPDRHRPAGRPAGQGPRRAWVRRWRSRPTAGASGSRRPAGRRSSNRWAIHRFDPASGRPIQPPIPSAGPVDRLAVTPDGRYLVGAVPGLHPDDRGGEADADRTRKWRTASIVVWETATGRVVRKVDVNAESDYATANEWPDAYLSLSPDGKSVTAWVQRGANRFEGMTLHRGRERAAGPSGTARGGHRIVPGCSTSRTTCGPRW